MHQEDPWFDDWLAEADNEEAPMNATATQPTRQPATPQERAEAFLAIFDPNASREDFAEALVVLQREAIAPILRVAAAVTRPCKACNVELFFVRTKPSEKYPQGSLIPYTADGVNHFINCPHAKEFKR